MDDLWNAKRKKLEEALIQAALSVFAHTKSVGFKVPIPDTRPVVFIVAGDENTLREEIIAKT